MHNLLVCRLYRFGTLNAFLCKFSYKLCGLGVIYALLKRVESLFYVINTKKALCGLCRVLVCLFRGIADRLFCALYRLYKLCVGSSFLYGTCKFTCGFSYKGVFLHVGSGKEKRPFCDICRCKIKPCLMDEMPHVGVGCHGSCDHMTGKSYRLFCNYSTTVNTKAQLSFIKPFLIVFEHVPVDLSAL